MCTSAMKGMGMLRKPAFSRLWKPCALLAPFVEEFSLREDRLGTMQIYNPLPAREDCFLQFYFVDRYRVVTVANGAVHRAPRCVLVGPHTRRREDLIWTGHLKLFTIRFSAVGFRALFGIPAREICDVAEAQRSSWESRRGSWKSGWLRLPTQSWVRWPSVFCCSSCYAIGWHWMEARRCGW
jgi:hypothetical protein